MACFSFLICFSRPQEIVSLTSYQESIEGDLRQSTDNDIDDVCHSLFIIHAMSAQEIKEQIKWKLTIVKVSFELISPIEIKTVFFSKFGFT